jgi:replicative DNA helicase
MQAKRHKDDYRQKRKSAPPSDETLRDLRHALEIEVLSNMLLGKAEVLAGILSPDHFRFTKHQHIVSAIISLLADKAPVSMISLATRLKENGHLEEAGGYTHLAYIAKEGTYTDSLNIKYNYRELLKEVKRDKVKNLASEMIDNTSSAYEPSEAIFETFEKLNDIANMGDFSATLKPVNEIIEDTALSLFNTESVSGLSSGLKSLDTLIGGFKPGQLILLAARPSVGKTALALNITEHAVLQEKKSVAFFSLETTNENILKRLITFSSGVPYRNVNQFHQKINSVVNKFLDAKLFVDDAPRITTAEIQNKCQQIKSSHGLDLVIIDYIQLIEPMTKSIIRENEISDISRNLKIMAKELEIPVIALSQLNRGPENRADNTPQLSDLRGSGALEQDADVVIFLHRKRVENVSFENKTKLIVPKQKEGPQGLIRLQYVPDTFRFAETDL